MSFDNVPDEILQQIVGNFAPRRRPWINYDRIPSRVDPMCEKLWASRLDLCRVSRTCKRLRSIALPTLYRTIIWPSPKLLIVLAESEYLASLIKAIDLEHLPTIRKEDESLLHKALTIGRLSRLPTTVKDWLSGLIGEDEDLSEGLLIPNREAAQVRFQVAPIMYLLLLPNLQLLFHAEHPEIIMRKQVLGDFLRQTGEFGLGDASNPSAPALFVPTPPRLAALRLSHASIDSHEDFLQPTVQRLEAFSMNWCPKSRTPPRSLPQRLALRHVHLREVESDGTCVVDILRRCPDLRTLKMEWTRYQQDPPDFAAMGNALRLYGRGLENLELHIGLHTREDHSDWTGRKLGSLRALIHLKSLALNHRSMQIVPSDEYGIEHLYEVQTLDQCLPDSLEKITFLNGRYQDTWMMLECHLQSASQSDLEELGDVCAEAMLQHKQLKAERKELHQQIHELLQAKARKKTLQLLRLVSNDFQKETEVLGCGIEQEKCSRGWQSVYLEKSVWPMYFGGTEIVRIS